MLRFLFALLATVAAAAAQDQPSTTPSSWHFTALVDGAFLLDSNHPANHLFRNRGTTAYVGEPVLNMSAAFLHKDASEQSRWGLDLTLQAGKDSEAFGFSAVAPNLGGSRWLRHLGPTAISYLAPVGNGLTIQGGIFNSFIGYDSLYAKDNLNYTRPWGGDFTPYLMMGINASYPVTPKVTASLFLTADYFHLAHPNNRPSAGGQVAYKANAHTTVRETALYGPHQADTALGFWRFLNDTLVEWKNERFTAAYEYQIGTEGVAEPGTPRALWSASQFPMRWTSPGPWSISLRPEFAWDRDGRWTGSPQFIKAITSTLEYRVQYRRTAAIFRLEHRYDNSHGMGGGFFRGANLATGEPGLTPSQHLLELALILTWEPRLHW